MEVPIPERIARSLATELVADLPEERHDGAGTRAGCKLYRRGDGWWLAGYAHGGSDVLDDLLRVGYLALPESVIRRSQTVTCHHCDRPATLQREQQQVTSAPLGRQVDTLAAQILEVLEGAQAGGLTVPGEVRQAAWTITDRAGDLRATQEGERECL